MKDNLFCEVFVKRYIGFVGFNILHLIICTVSYVWYKYIKVE